MSQLSPVIRDAVLGNVGSLVVFRIGAEDAQMFAREYHPIAVDELTEMWKFRAWVRLGESVQRSMMSALPPMEFDCGSRDIVIALSRRHFGRARMDVEKRIKRFMKGRVILSGVPQTLTRHFSRERVCVENQIKYFMKKRAIENGALGTVIPLFRFSEVLSGPA